jgi:dTMP kinase
LFISFDGIDGCGKSTQLAKFADHLTNQGHDVICYRDPGTTKLGETVRDILLHREEIPLAMTTEMLLYMSARAQLVAEQIKPAVESGKTVLCDRYLLANVVYQGHGGNVAPESIWQVGRIATDNLQPDMTFIFDLDPTIAMARVGAAHDRLEKRGLAYFQRIRAGYLTECSRLPHHAIIDATASIDEVHNQVIAQWNTWQANRC